MPEPLVPATPTYDLDAIASKVVQGYVIFVLKYLNIDVTQTFCLPA